MTLSIIVPCYNEEEVIKESFKRILEVCLKKQTYWDTYEIIFIDDGSKDKTFNTITHLSLNNSNIKAISFSRNFGHQNAVMAGIHHAIGDRIVIIDADLQDPPELIPDMIEIMINKKCNVVYGVRTHRKGESFFKKITAKLFYRLINKLSDENFPEDTGDFRLIDRTVADNLIQLNEKNKYIRGLISWIGFKQEPIYYERSKRFAGETKYTLKKMTDFALNGIFGFSKKPLKAALKLGMMSVAISIALIIWVICEKIFIPETLITGWASTIIVILFLGGTQLITVGIIGEYIGGIFDEVKKRPDYIIKEKVNF